MTTKSTSVTRPARALRSSLRLSVPAAVAGSALVAGPAFADVPEVWTRPDEPQFFEFFMILVGFPVIVALVVYALVSVANLRKKESPYSGIEGQWAGGTDGKGLHAAESAPGAGGASGSF
ncbi:hypothetical protein [Nocardioides yefusunii]|uniref:Uncharacterized protein n=1 Tax=Nocardioides yefusunii TaxID=2500546 RepID=A0ABW1QW97_9ACTN|nr:hypothetical protein [Nocardioides yefusunii]